MMLPKALLSNERQRLLGNETVVQRQFRGGVIRTFRRSSQHGGAWQCDEQPMRNPQHHLRDAIRCMRVMRGELKANHD